MPHPLELAYNWRLPVAVSTVGLVACVGLLARSQVLGWISAAVVLVLCYAVFLGVVWWRTQAYLMVDGADLTVRTFRAFHRIDGARVVKMSQLLTPNGPSYRLTVRAEDGRLARYTAPTALLRRGHSTLFGWILASAPQTELDRGSRRTLQTLRERGALPYADDNPDHTDTSDHTPDEPAPDTPTGSDPPAAEHRRAEP